MRRQPVPAVVTAALLAACADTPGDGWTGSTQPLEGGGMRVLNPAAGMWPADGGWTLEPQVRIGSIAGEGADVFGEVGALSVDAAGRIWVIDQQAREVRVFDAGGAHVRTFGRRGEGPGEFQRPGGILFGPGGDVWIPDVGNRRYSRWDTAGVELETRPMDTGAMHFSFVGTMTPDGLLYDVDMAPPAEGEPAVSPLLAAAGLGGGGEILRPVLHTGDGPLPPDTIEVPALDEPMQVFSARSMALGVPFSPSVRWLGDPHGRIWSGTTDEYRIVRASFAGDTSLIIEREYEPLSVTAADIDEWLEGAQRFLQAGGTIDRSRIPSTKPIFDDLIVDDAGYLWVRLITDEPGRRFDVFDPEGRYLGTVQTEDELRRIPRPVIRGSSVYAVAVDSLDVEYVVRYRIVGR